MVTKKIILLVSDTIMHNSKGTFDGRDLNKIFSTYAKIKSNGLLKSLGSSGITSDNPQAAYVEVSQSLFEYIGNQIVITQGMVAFESKVHTDEERGVTTLCCPYRAFSEFVKGFETKLQECMDRNVSILNELGEELLLVANLQKGICEPIQDMVKPVGVGSEL